MQYRPLPVNQVVALADALVGLCTNLEALNTIAKSAKGGHMEAVQVLWFCRVLKEDALTCLTATYPDGCDDLDE